MKRTLLTLLFVTVTSVTVRAQGSAQLLLIPQPREITAAGTVRLTRGVSLDAAPNASDRFAAQNLREALAERDIRVARAGTAASLRVRLLRASSTTGGQFLIAHKLPLDSAMQAEGYVLVVDGTRATVVGATAAGVFYGVQTLKQLFEGNGTHAIVRRATIRDWPAMRYRGLHDDLSRGPVPTLDFQKKQIRTFAAYKINVYSPYFEHTLEYLSNPLASPPGGTVTQDQVRELVAYASKYHITVVPEQEAFGHLHHVLKYELYAPLAETPHGHVIAPGQPGSMDLIRSMFGEIDSLFPGPFIHIGADETFELGRGQTAARVDSEGMGPVYLGFLKQIEEALRPTGKRLLFWGDIAQGSPDLVKTLPHDMIAVAWAYSPSSSFDRLVVPYRDAGMETWVAPGVNNWNRVYPDNSLALPNMQGFIRDGQRLGATGVLNTTWDDDGESIFNQTWYGVLFGAAASWQTGESSIERFESSYGRIFHGDTTGAIDEAQRKLTEAHALLNDAGVGDASDYLFWLDPFSVDGQLASARILPVASRLRNLAESALVLVEAARRQDLRETDALGALSLGARKMDFIGMKFQFANDIATLYARAAAAGSDREGRSVVSQSLGEITSMNGRAMDLRDGYSLTRDLFEQAWLRENRPYWLHNVLARYDAATQLWIRRADQVSAARREWGRTRELPSPESLGFPTPTVLP